MEARADGIDFLPELTASERRILITEGWIELKWPDSDEDTEVELQQGIDPAFAEATIRYRGPDRGSVITGLPEGLHYFRVREVGAERGDAPPWSEPLTVEVVFMDRGTLFLFLAIGGVVVVLTVGAIIAGHFSSKTTS